MEVTGQLLHKNPAYKAVFFDIEGTLVHDGELIQGAVETVAVVRSAGLHVRFLTNITGQMPATIARNLCHHGIEAADDEVQTAVSACAERLATRPHCRIHLLVPDTVRPLFEGLTVDDEMPDVVVIGDIADRFTFEVLDRAFRMVDAGAKMLALSRNMFWFNEGRKQLDAGAFIAALEAATGHQAEVCGKPALAFFEAALAAVCASPNDVLVVGDDVLTDVAGAAKAGIASCLVGTGKFRPNHRDEAAYTHFLPSVRELPELLFGGNLFSCASVETER